jgi:uncharacterized protein YpuA (DUF1002 family)
MVNEEEIEILLNIGYGGWKISKKAIELYKLRNPSCNVIGNDFNRHEPILVQIYKELGNDFDGKFSKTKIKKILKKYENYYEIDEYDGKEYVKINYTKYKLDNIYNKIKEILQSNNNDNTKINEIEQFISAFEM